MFRIYCYSLLKLETANRSKGSSLKNLTYIIFRVIKSNYTKFKICFKSINRHKLLFELTKVSEISKYFEFHKEPQVLHFGVLALSIHSAQKE